MGSLREEANSVDARSLRSRRKREPRSSAPDGRAKRDRSPRAESRSEGIFCKCLRDIIETEGNLSCVPDD